MWTIVLNFEDGQIHRPKIRWHFSLSLSKRWCNGLCNDINVFCDEIGKINEFYDESGLQCSCLFCKLSNSNCSFFVTALLIEMQEGLQQIKSNLSRNVEMTCLQGLNVPGKVGCLTQLICGGVFLTQCPELVPYNMCICKKIERIFGTRIHHNVVLGAHHQIVIFATRG